jgi:uncharacterized protein
MNPEERALLESFLGQLVQARRVVKDAEADALIGQAMARQPDGARLLVQRALLLEQGLVRSQARVRELEAKLQTQEKSTGFLSSANDWGDPLFQPHPRPARVEPGNPFHRPFRAIRTIASILRCALRADKG